MRVRVDGDSGAVYIVDRADETTGAGPARTAGAGASGAADA